MLRLQGCALNLSTPSPLTARREYEAYIRGPVGAITDAFGTRDKYRYGVQHLGRISAFPAPHESFSNEFGIQEAGTVTVAIAAPPATDATYAAFVALAAGWRNQELDLELVTRIYREDRTSVELVSERRGLAKATRRRGNTLELDIADFDRAALEALVPAKRYTLADFPKLFTDHVGRPVPQVVGTALKVPLTYVDNTPGAYRYLACEYFSSGPPTVKTLYRQGRIVNSADYVVDTVVVNGTGYLRFTFTAEQKDTNGTLWAFEADLVGAGPRAASEELRRILEQLGRTVHAYSFDQEALYCIRNGMYVDGGYIEPRQGIAIIQDLLQVARARLFKTPAGAYGIAIDRPREVQLALDDRSDQVEVQEYQLPEVKKTLKLEWKVLHTSAEPGEKYAATPLSRQTVGASGEEVFRNIFLREFEPADRWLCYMQKRANARAIARVRIYGVQLHHDMLIALRSVVTWNGWKVFSIVDMARPEDANEVTLLEYDESVHTYTPTAAPADAVNGYLPDYSMTPPEMPATLAVVSQGDRTDADGKVTSYALVRATPPATNWAKLMARVVNTTTKEQWDLQLQLNAGNYEATFGGLRPNMAHELLAWAVNGNNLDGFKRGPVAFNSSVPATLPAASSAISALQKQSFEVLVSWNAVADAAGLPPVDHYELYQSVNGGAYTKIVDVRGTQHLLHVSHGQTLQYKVRTVDRVGNTSVDSGVALVVPVKMISSSYIVDGGVNNANLGDDQVDNRTLGNSSVRAANLDWANTIGLYTLTPGQTVGIGTPGVQMLPTVRLQLGGSATGLTIVGTPGGTCMGARNDTGGNLSVRIEDPTLL